MRNVSTFDPACASSNRTAVAETQSWPTLPSLGEGAVLSGTFRFLGAKGLVELNLRYNCLSASGRATVRTLAEQRNREGGCMDPQAEGWLAFSA